MTPSHRSGTSAHTQVSGLLGPRFRSGTIVAGEVRCDGRCDVSRVVDWPRHAAHYAAPHLPLYIPQQLWASASGCKRSFLELWRLKVHCKAAPDIRGALCHQHTW